MRVCITWSSADCEAIALALKNWIPRVLQTAQIDIIPAGSNWPKFHESHIGILCHRELAGTAPSMFDEMDFKGSLPLKLQADKAGTFELIRTLNMGLFRLDQYPLPDALLQETFERWWSDFPIQLRNTLPSVIFPSKDWTDELPTRGINYYLKARTEEDTGEDIPEARIIRRAIDEERLLIVVGAGVSRAATAEAKESYWDGLLELGLKTVNDGIKRKVFSDLLAQKDPKCATYVAEAIEDALGGRSDFAFYSWLRETVGSLRPINRDVLEAIRDLRVPILTTNYDSLLEEVTGRKPITFDDVEESLSFVRNENVTDTILHIHGYYQQAQSVIFGTRSYYQLLDSKKYAEAILRALAIRYTWLFVGCGQGLHDPHFQDFILWLDRTLGNRVPPHYQLLAEEDQPMTSVRGRIRPISYGKTHEDLAPFLGSLIRSTRLRAPSDQPGDIIQPLEFCTGRDSELRAFRKALLLDYPKPVAILGGSGLGKTTFCYAGFCAPDVVNQYHKRQHYVRVDAATSAAAMLQAIARALRLQAPAALAGSFFDRTGRDLLDRITETVKKDRRLLILDGIQRAWHAKESESEAYLAKICEAAAASRSAIVVIITGYRRPLNVPWGLRVDLAPLSDDDGIRLFIEVARKIVKEMDENVSVLSDSDALRSLTKTLDGIPLAIKVMAHTAAMTVAQMVKDKKGGGTQEEWDLILSLLRNEWHEKREIALSSQERSFDASEGSSPSPPLFSLVVTLRVALSELERHTKGRKPVGPDASSIDLLGIIGMLPDGLPEEILGTAWPDKRISIECANTLTHYGMVFVQNGRLRAEPSIRAFARDTLESQIGEADKRRIVQYYFEKARAGEAIGWGTRADGSQANNQTDIASEIEAIKAEADNIEEIIRYELKQPDSKRVDIGIRAALALGRFYRFSGVESSLKIIKEAYEKACERQETEDDKELKADCSRVLGSMERLRYRLDTAKTRYGDAEGEYDGLSDVRQSLGRGHCERARGDMERDSGDQVRQEAAIKHYQMALYQYDQTLKVLKVEAATDIRGKWWQAKRGKAWCQVNISDLTHMSKSYDTGEDEKVTNAKQSYEEAANEFQKLGEAIGEGRCQKGLGDISCIIMVDPHKGPSQFYEEARRLFNQSGYKVGVADCEYSLGDEALRSSDGEKAEKHYNDALVLYGEIGSLHGVANCFYSLGDVRLLGSRKKESDKLAARKKYHDALKRYEEIGSRLGPANCHRGLGDTLSLQERDDEYKESTKMLIKAFGQAGVKPSFTFGQDYKRWRR